MPWIIISTVIMLNFSSKYIGTGISATCGNQCTGDGRSRLIGPELEPIKRDWLRQRSIPILFKKIIFTFKLV